MVTGGSQHYVEIIDRLSNQSLYEIAAVSAISLFSPWFGGFSLQLIRVENIKNNILLLLREEIQIQILIINPCLLIKRLLIVAVNISSTSLHLPLCFSAFAGAANCTKIKC